MVYDPNFTIHLVLEGRSHCQRLPQLLLKTSLVSHGEAARLHELDMMFFEGLTMPQCLPGARRVQGVGLGEAEHMDTSKLEFPVLQAGVRDCHRRWPTARLVCFSLQSPSYPDVLLRRSLTSLFQLALEALQLRKNEQHLATKRLSETSVFQLEVLVVQGHGFRGGPSLASCRTACGLYPALGFEMPMCPMEAAAPSLTAAPRTSPCPPRWAVHHLEGPSTQY